MQRFAAGEAVMAVKQAIMAISVRKHDESKGERALERFEECVARARERVIEAYAQGGRTGGPDTVEDWTARVRRALTALLELFDEDPSLARVLLVDSSEGAGQIAERRSQLLAEVGEALYRPKGGASAIPRSDGGLNVHWDMSLDEASEGIGRDAGVHAFGRDAVVRAVASVVQTHLRRHPCARLVGLVDPLMAVIVLPDRGLTASAWELAGPASSR